MEYEVWIERKFIDGNGTFDTISSIHNTRIEAQAVVDQLSAKGQRAWIEVDHDSLFDEDFDKDDFDVSEWNKTWNNDIDWP